MLADRIVDAVVVVCLERERERGTREIFCMVGVGLGCSLREAALCETGRG